LENKQSQKSAVFTNDSATVKILCKICIVHCVEGITPQIYGNGFMAFEHRMDIIRATMETQVKCSEMKKSGAKIFRVAVSCDENCILLALFIF
jgi:hypothetical protein